MVENIYDNTTTFVNNTTECASDYSEVATTSPIGPYNRTLPLANLSSLTGELSSLANVC